MSRVLLSIGIVQLVIMLVALVRAKVLSVLLGPAGYGVVATVDQTVVSLVHLGALSLPFTALKFMSRRHSDGAEPFEQTYATFLRALVAVGIVAVLAAGALLTWKPDLFGHDLAAYRGYFYLAILGVPAAILNILFINTLAAAQRGAASAVLSMLVLLILAVAAIAGVVLHGIAGLYVATVIAGVLAALASAWYLRRSLGVRVTARTRGLLRELRESPEIVSYSLLIYVAVAAYSLTMLGTRYFVFAGTGAVGAGLLQALLAVSLTVGAVITPMNGLFLTPLVNRRMPAAAKAAAANDFGGKVAALLLLGGVAVALFPRLVLTLLFSASFADGAAALYLFLIWQCLYQIVNVYLQLLIGLDDVGFFAGATIVSYGCAALLFPPLISRYGLGGAAMALSAAMVVSAIAASVRLRVTFGVAVGLRVWLRSGYCLAAIAGAALVFRSMDELTPAGILARVGYGILVSMLLLLTLTADERQMLGAGWQWTRRRMGWLGAAGG